MIITFAQRRTTIAKKIRENKSKIIEEEFKGYLLHWEAKRFLWKNLFFIQKARYLLNLSRILGF